MQRTRKTYRIPYWWEVSTVELIVILIDVLIRQIAAEEDAVDLAVGPGEVAQCPRRFALLNELIDPLQVEPRRRATDQAIAAELKG